MPGFLSFLIFLASMVLSDCAILNTSVKRVVDLTRHIIKIQSDIQFTVSSEAVEEYMLLLSPNMSSHLSFVTAKCGKTSCEIVKSKKQPKKDVVHYTVMFKEPLQVNESGTLKITAYFTRVLVPFPAEIKQNEDQLVVFEDSHLFASPYDTKTQTMKVKMPSGHIEDFSRIEPWTKKGSSITYGPYMDIAAYNSPADSFRAHYKNHYPFLTITNLIKEIEVSMWGRVSVEEVYDLLHSGAKLKGGFSRFEYTAQGAVGASFHSLEAILPKDATNVYYRDQIGNVSTSRLRQTSTRQELEFKPRFPIFGGWKTQWYFGYSVPTHSVLSQNNGQFKLEMDFSTALQNAAVDELTVKIILPEGATDLDVSIPYEVNSMSTAVRHTYLDTPMYGRPVLILKKANVVDQHNIPFVVTFRYSSSFMMHEPFQLVFAFLSLFILCMVIVRVDLSLFKQKNKKE